MTMSESSATVGGTLGRGAPCYGEDNEYVYGELLGMSKREISDLASDGVPVASRRSLLVTHRATGRVRGCSRTAVDPAHIRRWSDKDRAGVRSPLEMSVRVFTTWCRSWPTRRPGAASPRGGALAPP